MSQKKCKNHLTLVLTISIVFIVLLPSLNPISAAFCNSQNNFQNKHASIQTIIHDINEKINNFLDKISNNKQNEKDNDNSVKEKAYIVVNTRNSENVNDDEIIKELNETEFNNLKNDVEKLQEKSITSYDLVNEQLKILAKYDIIPNYFTLDNLTEAINQYQTGKNIYSNSVINGEGNNGDGKTTIGPHLIFYGSLFSNVVNFQPLGKLVIPPPFYGIHKALDMLNIQEGTLLYDFLYNTTLFHYFMYAPIEVLFGGSLGHYLSIGLFPGVQSYQISNTPFIGIYMFMFGGGIYIYQAHEDGVDNAVMDLFIGFSPFSMVTNN